MRGMTVPADNQHSESRASMSLRWDGQILRTKRAGRSGFTLLEVMVASAVMLILASAAVPAFGRWQETQRARTAARTIAEALLLARSSAIRSGNNHVVFFRTPGVGTSDAAGNDIADTQGNSVPILVINDGPAAAANCHIDPGETIKAYPFVQGSNWGTTVATANAPLDTNVTNRAQGVTFASPTNAALPVPWVLFRGDGIPVTFSGDALLGCDVIGSLGSASGGVYLTSTNRDFAIVLTPVGTSRLHVWNPGNAAWSN
jgi:prepilin-type N-terminal cleavage/methylation domain-containing protein